MENFKKTYLVDFSFNAGDLRTANFDEEYEAKQAVEAISIFFLPEEINLLQMRIRYDKPEDDEK